MDSQKRPLLVILGGGESGTGAALLGQFLGFEVFLSDSGLLRPSYKLQLEQAGIRFEEGMHSEAKILDAQEIIKSPGIDPKKSEILQKAKKKKISIVGEIEFASRYTSAFHIGITGTNGKTTTTLLTYHILKKAGKNVRLAGNVGTSYAAQVLQELKDRGMEPFTQAPDGLPPYHTDLIYVLELSSFMLDTMYDFKANIGVITNITPDHLDRYDYKIEKYVESKFRIIRNMDSDCYFIYGIDSELIENQLFELDTPAKELPFSMYPDEFDGACGDEHTFVIQFDEAEYEFDFSKSTLKGKHNVYNAMAAALCAVVIGVPSLIIQAALEDFENDPHRMQYCGSIQGIAFCNDSKATNVDSAWYALDAVPAPIVWIAGGVDKGNDYTALYEVIKDKVVALVCLGMDNEKLEKAFKGKIPTIKQTQSVSECIDMCLQLGSSGSTALLSPCCASFDLFRNYEDRGNQFMEEVRKRIQQ